jgi:biopolymer transport protein ExbB/TolQ
MSPWPMRILVAGIVVVVASPMVGLIITVCSMIGAFHTLGANGISDPKVLAGDVGNAVLATMVGLIISATIGLPLIIAGAVMLANRPGQSSAPPPA